MVDLRRRLRSLSFFLYLSFLIVYAAGSADRLLEPPFYNHYSYLADSLLHGSAELVRAPPHQNDWAVYEGRWYVSFPPVPAILMMPGVAIWGWDPNARSPVPASWRSPGTDRGRFRFNEALFNLLFAPFPPLLLFLVLERLRRSERSTRTQSENVLLTCLFGLGTVYFPAAVQADTWHIAHVVGCTFLGLYVLASLEGRHPVLAGAALGLAFGCRTPMIFAFPFFIYEAARAQGATRQMDLPAKLRAFVRPAVLSKLIIFGVIAGAFVLAWLLFNDLRFGDPFDFGHRHLFVRWTPRIERWGLFDIHYLSRNLAAMLVLTPWIVDEPPYLQLGYHGLAIWVTTPALLYLLWPGKRTIDVMDTPPRARRLWPEWRSELLAPLWICVAAVALPSLLYHNTGWMQFGYRFSNDYMIFLVMLLAVRDRPITRSFRALVVVSVVVCTFGALTFNRVSELYHQDLSQDVFFQPD